MSVSILLKGWNFIYARVTSWWAGPRFGMVLESKENESAKLEVKAEPPMGFDNKLALEKFAYMAGAGNPEALAQEKQKMREAEEVGIDPADCTVQQPGELGLDLKSYARLIDRDLSCEWLATIKSDQ